MGRRHLAGLGLALLLAGTARAQDEGLLFRLSADHGLAADRAAGGAAPNFQDKITLLPAGRLGGALSAADDGVLAWTAPGNIYAQRGTLSFYWRSRYPVGEGPFAIFRVGYADHSSWDMAWLRIDWNGQGFDAFVTDANLARIRVSWRMAKPPAPDAWSHIAFAWDETRGVELFVDGKLVADKAAVAVLDSGLDQFGVAGRVVSPHQVQSRYNFMRGGDYDEIRIYDHALDASTIAALASGTATAIPAAAARGLDDPAAREEWRWRYGWNRKDERPPELTAPVTRIRKVEFADVRDLKQWMWKGTDGVPETTWPGVYNRSRLPGRNDYFTLPDWNVYVEGGKRLTLTLPDEPWNRLEIQGAAWGDLSWSAGGGAPAIPVASRPKDQERTVHQLPAERTGGVLTFTSAVQETPIQEIAAYDVGPGAVPQGSTQLSYTVRAGAAPDYPDLDELNGFIAGRYPADERATVVALPEGAPMRARPADPAAGLPILHLLIPYEFGASPPGQPLNRSWGYGWENMDQALDGIAIDLPPLKGADGAAVALNIQVKDPIWPGRNLMDVSVSVPAGQGRTLWLDARDRIAPNRSLYLTIAADGPLDAPGLSKALDGARIRLVFKPRAEGLAEHVADRLNQVKDNWGFLVEEHTASKREALFRRLEADMGDLLRVDPDNRIAREYWADITYGSQGALPFAQPKPPPRVPLWAFRQLEDLEQVRRFVDWWIDNRQVAYGDFGGGISDDTDLLEQWPGLALMGVEPDKITASHRRLADAAYRNGMFTAGLSTIVTDELHSYEEGINSNSEALYLGWGDPKAVERLMTTVAAYPRIIQPNPAGHLHFVSSWYSGAKAYREAPWEWSKYYSYLVLHPGLLMGAYNGDPAGRRFVVGLADGILAHGKPGTDGTVSWPDEINWRTDATRGTLPPNTAPMQLFWAAWRWTGEARYLLPILAAQAKGGNGAVRQVTENALAVLDRRGDWGAAALKAAQGAKATNLDRYLAWETTGDKRWLEALYGDELQAAAQRMYSQTEGHWWTDRVEIPSEFLQRTRLGGVALMRNWLWPGHTVSWRFDQDVDAEAVAILVPGATPRSFKVIAFNTADHPVKAKMSAWNVTAGRWRMSSGIDRNGDDKADGAPPVRTLDLERSASVDLVFEPGQATVASFELESAGAPTETRADLGIGSDDLKRAGRALQVRVHSLGARDAPAGTLVLEDAAGHVLARAKTPALKAPRDLKPRTAVVTLKFAAGADLKGAHVRIALPVPEITQLNNSAPAP
jgi:hypothetical protein